VGTAAKVVAYGRLARDFHAFLLTLKFQLQAAPGAPTAEATPSP